MICKHLEAIAFIENILLKGKTVGPNQMTALRKRRQNIDNNFGNSGSQTR